MAVPACFLRWHGTLESNMPWSLASGIFPHPAPPTTGMGNHFKLKLLRLFGLQWNYGRASRQSLNLAVALNLIIPMNSKGN
jgi:hypothetical protein